MDHLLKELSKLISNGQSVEFTTTRHFNGHFIEIKIDKEPINHSTELYKSLEDWLGYEPFGEYLNSNSIYYDYSGSFKIINSNLALIVDFIGPYEDEFEELTIQLEEKQFNTILSLAEYVHQKEMIQINFIRKNDNFIQNPYLTLNGDDKAIKLSVSEIGILKEYISEFIELKKHTLNINRPHKLESYYECEEGFISTELVAKNTLFFFNEIATDIF